MCLMSHLMQIHAGGGEAAIEQGMDRGRVLCMAPPVVGMGSREHVCQRHGPVYGLLGGAGHSSCQPVRVLHARGLQALLLRTHALGLVLHTQLSIHPELKGSRERTQARTAE